MVVPGRTYTFQEETNIKIQNFEGSTYILQKETIIKTQNSEDKSLGKLYETM
jgi:hypothetical protein